MRYFVEAAVNRHPAQSLEKCFEANLQRKLRSRQLTTPPGYFFCHRVTFTPTRLLLEGPNITQSNRVIRDFKGYEDFFLRVSFRDEDRLQYRWTRDVNGLHLLQTRVGQTLKQGFDLAGRHFDFLAYSQSALKAHTVWFVSPFYHKEREQWVTAGSIRNSLGDFRKDILYPSRYGARIALAFTSTDPSIKIHKDRWSEIPDIKDRGVVFTDGVGTISQELSDMIWTVLCQNYGVRGGNVVQPSAYQIRFLGYKGIVCVDQQLKGIYMCLRESMKKFDVPGKVYADIEIAGVFNKPKTANLNRPLVMVLEDRGAASQAFLDLQEDAVSKTRRVGESAEMFASLLETYNLCGDFRLADILRRLGTLGLGLNPEVTPFFAQLRSCATNHVLRYLKYRARIPIPDSHKLVGVADIGPDYIKKGYENVYCLPPGRIFGENTQTIYTASTYAPIPACIQNSSDEEPKWIRGMCIVSRSPVVHPGDVQRAYAIGKPPADKLCLFSHLRNVVVFPSQGARSLPNSLAGGDLDGDLYEVIQYEPFLIPEHYDPAGYLPAKPFSLGRPSTIEDVFYTVLFLSSVLSHSKDGTLDKDCIKLAELHTQAVDYPKNGNKVDTHDLPRELIAFKPDWHAVERSVHHNTDYYESPRALGHLYRNITLEKIPDYPSTAEEYLNDPITKLLHPLVQNQLRGHKCQTDRDWMNTVYMGYREELTYMSTTYSLSKSPLREEQLVAGIILENCSSEVHKKDRVYAMKESLRFLVRDTREELFGIGDLSTDSDKEVRKKMACGWDVWVYSHENAAKNPTAERFGSRSFGLIALGHVLDCLVRLGSLHSQ
ncbi:hypothetical protein ID866_6657 [Astraeus odoratus]|nr:hypothetical protein ID866_6657 [Astraeus odoratus]